jgi:hypothetical protein
VQRAAWAYVDVDKMDRRDAVGPAEALALHKRHAERQERSAAGRARAAEMGVEIVDPQGLWGRGAAAHRLVDDDAVTVARAAGTLAAALDETGELYWVTTSTPGAAAATDDDRGEVERAGKTRAEACQKIAARKVPASEALRRTAFALLTPVNHAGASRLAHGWMRTAGIGPDLASTSKYLEAVRASGDNALIQQVGCAMALAADELRVRDALAAWTPEHATHVRRLTVEAEYQPTAWELRRLAHVDAETSPTEE